MWSADISTLRGWREEKSIETIDAISQTRLGATTDKNPGAPRLVALAKSCRGGRRASRGKRRLTRVTNVKTVLRKVK